MSRIIFGNKALSIKDIVAISRKEKSFSVNRKQVFIDKINAGFLFIKKVTEENKEIYGVTTGYGDSCTNKIPKELQDELPYQLARFHGCGMGNHFDSEITRAIIATRLSSLVSGVSGISFELLERIEFLLKNDILPRIPEEGSVGASGDLTPLSYIARALIGEEEVLYKNKIQNAGDVYKELGVKPYVLKPKETLAIINGTSVMTAIATIAYIRSEYLGKLCCRLTAMAIQALKGNFDHFDKDLFSVKPHPGQMQVAEFKGFKNHNKKYYPTQEARYCIFGLQEEPIDGLSYQLDLLQEFLKNPLQRQCDLRKNVPREEFFFFLE